MITILALLIGLLAGAAIAFFYAKGKSESELSVANEKARMLDSAVSDLKQEIRTVTQTAEARLLEERKAAEARLLEERKAAEARLLHDRAVADSRIAEERQKVESLSTSYSVANTQNENLQKRLV